MKLSTAGHEVADDVRMLRTIVVFEICIDYRWYVSLPGWSHDVLIGIRMEDIPDFILEKTERHFRCYAQINVGEDNPFKLVFEEWEIGETCKRCNRGTFTFTGDMSNFRMRCNNCGTLT